MIQFFFLSKAEKDVWLPIIFDLLYNNMKEIAPSGLPYEQEKAQWLSAVSPALEKEPRKIIMCISDDELVGYIQYYTRNDLLMIEEVQIKKPYQRTLIFHKMCKYLATTIPINIEFIEAYADERNSYSQKLMKKLGMEQSSEACSPGFIHLRSKADVVRKLFI